VYVRRGGGPLLWFCLSVRFSSAPFVSYATSRAGFTPYNDGDTKRPSLMEHSVYAGSRVRNAVFSSFREELNRDSRLGHAMPGTGRELAEWAQAVHPLSQRPARILRLTRVESASDIQRSRLPHLNTWSKTDSPRSVGDWLRAARPTSEQGALAASGYSLYQPPRRLEAACFPQSCISHRSAD
jgi:hypothetical protein